MKKNQLNDISRRSLVKALGAAATASTVFTIVGCGGNSTSNTADPVVPDDESSPDPSGSGSDQITSELSGADWASGGTAALSAAFPPANPFKQGLGQMCSATPSYTLGPCYFNPDEYRQDISDGETGIPMILCFKVVDGQCQPLADVDVDIWHCDREGLYSANSNGSSDAQSFSPSFCSGDDPLALSSRWFRGVQRTDTDGFVYFKSCFPGWYPGRTTHIHVKIVRDGVQSLVSQLGYDSDLSREIYLNHPDYLGVEQDTTNATDNIFRSSSPANYAFYITHNDDDSMTAYKTIQLSI